MRLGPPGLGTSKGFGTSKEFGTSEEVGNSKGLGTSKRVYGLSPGEPQGAPDRGGRTVADATLAAQG